MEHCIGKVLHKFILHEHIDEHGRIVWAKVVDHKHVRARRCYNALNVQRALKQFFLNFPTVALACVLSNDITRIWPGSPATSNGSLSAAMEKFMLAPDSASARMDLGG